MSIVGHLGTEKQTNSTEPANQFQHPLQKTFQDLYVCSTPGASALM